MKSTQSFIRRGTATVRISMFVLRTHPPAHPSSGCPQRYLNCSEILERQPQGNTIICRDKPKGSRFPLLLRLLSPRQSGKTSPTWKKHVCNCWLLIRSNNITSANYYPNNRNKCIIEIMSYCIPLIVEQNPLIIEQNALSQFKELQG